jgi:hypothetical protein
MKATSRELGDKYRTFLLARCGRCCGELRPPIESVGSLAGFDLCELGCYRDSLSFGEASD